MATKSATIRVSSEGNVELPSPIRRELGIHAGDLLETSIENGKIVLKPQSATERKAPLMPQIIKNPILGTPALTFGPDAPILTSEEVAEMLAEFP